MCGIFGYIGKKEDAANIVLAGLKTLEYRGYDSWGIAISLNGKVEIEKHVGKIGNAETVLPKGSLAIGHTRWATHGGVTKENAHPHQDCTKEVAVIHNGIIENFLELKQELVQKGHKFISETDTEVVAHLVEENLAKEDFVSAFRNAFNKLKGFNAIVAVHAPSKKIIAAKTGSPLVVGIGEKEFLIASDAAGIAQYTKKVLFMEDNQMVVLGDKIELLALPSGKELEPKIETLDWDFETADMGKYEHFLMKEINDQRDSIAQAATQNEKDLFAFAKLIEDSFGTYLVGCGTAAHACRMGTYIFSMVAKKHVNFCVGSEFSYFDHFLTPESLLIAASQSGETADLIEAVSAARKRKSKVASVVNVVGSTLYRGSDLVLPLRAGLEKAVLSTKAFTGKITLFYLLAFILSGEYERGRKMLLQAAGEVGKLLDDESLINQIKEIAGKISASSDIYILGRGLSFPLALEAAHKIKEASYIHAEGFAGGEPKHCEISLVSKGTPAIIFAPNDETRAAIISNAMEFKARGAYIIGISPEKHEVFDEWIKVPDLGIVSPIINIIPGQLLAYFLALEKGNDPDKPRNLAKSVTVK